MSQHTPFHTNLVGKHCTRTLPSGTDVPCTIVAIWIDQTDHIALLVRDRDGTIAQITYDEITVEP